MSKKYIIENKIFKELYKKAENVSNSLIVLDTFCNLNNDIYEVQNIHPLIKYISNEAGSLNNYLLNKLYAEKGEKITFHM